MADEAQRKDERFRSRPARSSSASTRRGSGSKRGCAPAVLVAEIASLTLWVSLKGLSADYQPGENGGGPGLPRACSPRRRSGVVAHLATRKRRGAVHGAATTRGGGPRPRSRAASGRTRASPGRRTCSTGSRTRRCSCSSAACAGWRRASRCGWRSSARRSRRRAASTSTSTCSFATCPRSCGGPRRSSGRSPRCSSASSARSASPTTSPSPSTAPTR